MEYNEIKRIIDDVGNSNLTALKCLFQMVQKYLCQSQIVM